jgi:hypothetical protein
LWTAAVTYIRADMPHAATIPRTVVVALGVLLLTGTSASSAVATEWTVKQCVLESSPQPLSDGYQQTTVHFAVTPRSVALVSAAPLDAGTSPLGMKVDSEPFVGIDRLDGDRKALFDSNYERVVEQFKAGTQVKLMLRFWPTWPATGTQTTTLSLIGFTRAYGELAGCR